MLQSKGKIEDSLKRSRESWFYRIAGIFNRPRIEEQTWEELEDLLVSADVGISTTEKLLQKVKGRIRQEKIAGGEQVRDALKEEIIALLRAPAQVQPPPRDKTLVILVIGVNGSGKTTSIAKLASAYKDAGEEVILAAADTFRAAAIDQLKIWGKRAGVDVIAQQPGADPGAVVFDALQASRSRGASVVIVDTAGRLHTRYNLMEELKKIKRVIDRHDAAQEILLVLDATTGQNGLIQARQFSDTTGVSGIFLSKLDGTARGGIVLAIADQLGIPIRYIGTGEGMGDMAPFDAVDFTEAIFKT